MISCQYLSVQFSTSTYVRKIFCGSSPPVRSDGILNFKSIRSGNCTGSHNKGFLSCLGSYRRCKGRLTRFSNNNLDFQSISFTVIGFFCSYCNCTLTNTFVCDFAIIYIRNRSIACIIAKAHVLIFQSVTQFQSTNFALGCSGTICQVSFLQRICHGQFLLTLRNGKLFLNCSRIVANTFNDRYCCTAFNISRVRYCVIFTFNQSHIVIRYSYFRLNCFTCINLICNIRYLCILRNINAFYIESSFKAS